MRSVGVRRIKGGEGQGPWGTHHLVGKQNAGARGVKSRIRATTSECLASILPEPSLLKNTMDGVRICMSNTPCPSRKNCVLDQV